MKSTIRKALALLAFLTLAALLIPLGNTFLVQLDTFATLTMRDMRERDDIELAIVGSSIVQHHFNPALISEATGLTAFDATITNMVMPDVLALTHELYRTNSPDWVVLVLEAYSFDSVKTDPQTQMKLMPHLSSPVNRLRYLQDVLEKDGDKLSRVLLFNTFGFQSFSDVRKAVRLRTDPEAVLAELQSEHPGDYLYADGFVRRQTDERATDALIKTVIREETGYTYEVYDYTKDKLREFKALCEEHGSKLMVILAPGMTAHALAEPGYLPYLESAQAFFGELGVPCFNLMFAREELLPCLDDLYYDLYHMVGEGADTLSAAFARLFNAYLAGEDTSGWFYPDAQAYLASIDFITNCWLTQETGADGQVTLRADCNRGTLVTPQYRFTLVQESGEETLLRDWSEDAVLTCDAQALAGGTPRAYARADEGGESVCFTLGETDKPSGN